jgi:subtilisin family serine protease
MFCRHVASPAALALLLLVLVPASVTRADPACEVVVAITPSSEGAAALPAARLQRLGLRPRGSLAGSIAWNGAAPPGAAGGPGGFDPARIWLLEAPDPAAAAAALDSLRADPAVEWAEPNRVRAAAVIAVEPLLPDDPLLRDGRQWGLENPGPAGPAGGAAGADIRAAEAWTRCTGANDLRLAVADTGIDPAQPDLGGAMPDGSPRLVLAANVTGVEPGAMVADSNGHGTPVCGVLAARTNDGPHFDSLGVAGVCGGDGAGNAGCRIVPIKIAPRHSGSATSYAVAAAIAHATAAGARAMNLSFAGDAPSRVERLALHHAITHGCVVVAASGNHGYSTLRARMYPASFAADGLCIQVGASDALDRRTVWSGYGPDMDLVAPGLGIWTTFMTYPSAAGVSYPGYAAFSGTSFAAPFVTGTVGLLAAARPELTDVDFRHVLRESAHDIGEPGVDSTTGWGRLDAAAALAAVAPGIGVWHDEVPATSFRAVGLDTLTVGEGGFGSLGRWLGRHPAQRIEATAVVALPDSFLGPVRAWPRVGGTTTVRGDWTLPWYAPRAEVVEWLRPGTALPGGSRAFTLRGHLYRVLAADSSAAPGDEYVPLPPEQARFGFTVLGRVDRPPAVTVLVPAAGTVLAPGDTLLVRWSATDPDEVGSVGVALVPPGRAPIALALVAAPMDTAAVVIPCAAPPGPAELRVTARDEHGPQRDEASAAVAVEVRAVPCGRGGGALLRAAPNPFRTDTRIAGPAATRVDIFDLAGRLRRTALLDGEGGFTWDGHDGSGRRVAPGIYFLRARGLARTARLVRIE